MKLKLSASLAAACIVGGLAVPARADDQAPPPLFPLPYGMKLSGHVEAGVSYNPDDPANNINFGQTFTDRDNSLRMNQLMLGLERDIDPSSPNYNWGFKAQVMYGTDSRVTHFFNEFDRITNSPYQFDVTELDVQAHLPYWFKGTDVKLGQYPTPIGYEVIDATGNPLYSHSYIFFYGLPFKHTGLLTTTHVNDTVDIWAGIDTGVNDSIGDKGMVNNEFPKALFGFGLNNLMNGRLSILALSHIGPEASRFAGPGANNKMLQIYDAVITYKISDALTSATELNYIKSDFAQASGGGVATYLTYSINDQWSVTGRAEAFADQNGTFVGVGTESLDYVNGQRGLAPVFSYGAGATPYNVTYGEITLGATYKPATPWKQINFMVRPEVRYDSVIGGTAGLKPYDVNSAGVGTKSSQFTLAVDLVMGF